MISISYEKFGALDWHSEPAWNIVEFNSQNYNSQNDHTTIVKSRLEYV